MTELRKNLDSKPPRELHTQYQQDGTGAAKGERIDADRLDMISLGDPDYRIEILQVYLKNAEAYVGQIKRAVDDKDYQTIENISHKLKGISAHLGIKDLPVVALKLEN
ncbi:MAG: Hpt domain-containing protein, partial [Pseudomonadota bacterium]